MKAKIIGCSKVSYWYNDRIGETFNVGISVSPAFYRLTDDDSQRNDIRHIERRDCLLLNSETAKSDQG